MRKTVPEVLVYYLESHVRNYIYIIRKFVMFAIYFDNFTAVSM